MPTHGKTTTSTNGRELTLERVIDAPREKVFKAWTDPELMKQWFAPKPYTTPRVENDVRAGGSSLVVMRSPEGQEFLAPASISRWCRTSGSLPPTRSPRRGSRRRSRS